MTYLDDLFGLSGQVAIVTGGSGAIGSVLATGLASAGANVAVLGRRREACEAIAGQIRAQNGDAITVTADVLQLEDLERARATVLERWGRIDILVNAAGGNVPTATISGDQTFFDLPPEGFQAVFDLNLIGTLLPCQVFGQAMVARDGGPPRGNIVNISSMAATRALTRVVGYSAAKGAVETFTRWLAVDLARRYGDGLRVNAIAPGFFVGEQNRVLLMQPDGELTPRGQAIIAHSPAGRFGDVTELQSTLIWLCAPGSSFVTGIVVPVDGGFSAFSGV